MPRRSATAVKEAPAQAAPATESLDLAPSIQIEVVRAEFLSVLTKAGEFIDPRPSRPIMANLKLNVDGKACTVFASDEASSILIKTEVISSTAPVEFTLPKLTIKILEQIKDTTVTLKVRDDHTVSIEGATQTGSVNVLSAEDFPYLPDVEIEQFIEFDAAELINILDRVIPFTSGDETKQILTGVYLCKDFAATDGHRLGVVSLPPEVQETLTYELAVPAKFLSRFRRIAPQGVVKVQWAEHSPYVTFELNDMTLTSRVLDGQYPNYRQLLPKQFAHTITFDRVELMHSLDYAKLIAEQKNNIIVFDFNGETITIGAEAAECGKTMTDTKVPSQGVKITNGRIAFNVNYVIEALKVSKSPKVEMNINSATSPVVWKFPKEGNFVYLLMPVQIRE